MFRTWAILTRAALWALAAGGLAAGVLTGCSHKEPSGGPIDATVSFGEVGLSPGQFSYPRCLDHDEHGLWVIDKQARVQRLDPTTGECLGGWQMPEWSNGKPCGVTVWEPPGSDGPLIFIADTHYNRVMVYDGGTAAETASKTPVAKGGAQGRLLTRFGVFGKGDGQFIFPTDVAIVPTPDGKAIARLYVSEYEENDRISVFEPDVPVTKESLLAMIAAQGPNPAAALAQAVDAGTGAGDQPPAATGGASSNGNPPAPHPPVAGAIPLLADCPFKFKFAFGHYGSGDSASDLQFDRPQSMAVDLKRKELIVADACNHRLGRLTLDGKLIKWISGPGQVGQEPGHFAYPYGLCLLEDGTALVAEYGNNRVQHVDLETGASLGIYGQAGHGPGQLAIPWGITVLGKTAYVLDSGNNRVIGFEKPRLGAHGGEQRAMGGPGAGGGNG